MIDPIGTPNALVEIKVGNETFSFTIERSDAQEIRYPLRGYIRPHEYLDVSVGKFDDYHTYGMTFGQLTRGVSSYFFMDFRMPDYINYESAYEDIIYSNGEYIVDSLWGEEIVTDIADAPAGEDFFLDSGIRDFLIIDSIFGLNIPIIGSLYMGLGGGVSIVKDYWLMEEYWNDYYGGHKLYEGNSWYPVEGIDIMPVGQVDVRIAIRKLTASLAYKYSNRFQTVKASLGYVF